MIIHFGPWKPLSRLFRTTLKRSRRWWRRWPARLMRRTPSSPTPLQLENLEADAAEDDLIAEEAAAKTTTVIAFERKRPARKPFPDHLPRERVVVPAPCSCPACGGDRLSKLGEDVIETLEVIPCSWKVVQTVREKFSCRDCDEIAQAPAPFHDVPRGWAGPSFLAMLIFEKYGQHQPLNRQAERFCP